MLEMLLTQLQTCKFQIYQQYPQNLRNLKSVLARIRVSPDHQKYKLARVELLSVGVWGTAALPPSKQERLR